MFQTLSQRAWLITILPALTGIVFAVLVGVLCLDLDALILAEVENSQKLLNSQDLSNDYLHVLESGFSEYLSGKRSQDMDNDLRLLHKKLYEFVASAKDDKELLARLTPLIGLQKEIEDAANAPAVALANKPARESMKLHSLGITGRLYKALLPLFDVMHQRSIQAETSEKYVESRLTYVIVAGFLLNIFISFVLVYWFSKRVVKRMDVLHSAARSLSENQPIVARLEGDDEIKRLELKLVGLSEELASAQQRKQDFLAMISHDLRSPLTSLEMMLDMFQSGIYGNTSTTISAGFGQQGRNVRRLVHFISDLLDLEKIEAGSLVLNKETVELNSLLQQLVAKLSPVADQENKRIELIPPESNEYEISVDRDRLELALTRIITACILETFGPVKIRVNARQFHLPTITIETQTGSTHAVVSKRIFRRFEHIGSSRVLFQEHRHSLALARELLRMHGGDIEFSAAPMQARFRINFNREQAAEVSQ